MGEWVDERGCSKVFVEVNNDWCRAEERSDENTLQLLAFFHFYFCP